MKNNKERTLMSDFRINKTFQEINEKIKKGEAVVVTADEMIRIVKEHGPVDAASSVDVVTTGTFAPMCSSGAFINFGHTQPTIKASKVWMNNVPAYSGLAAVDCYVGVTEPCEDDPLNKKHPGEFNYGGGHVIEDLVAGKDVHLKATAYGTDCYPNRAAEKTLNIKDLPYAVLTNPRNAYQNYNCAINMAKKIKYTYMGVLKPKMGNANYCSAGQLSPLFNDPLYKTIGLGTRIFLGGAQGYVTWQGTQHAPGKERTPKGAPLSPSGTIFVMGDMKEMNSRWLRGISLIGYGSSLAVGLGIPIPILNEGMAEYTGVSDDELFTQIVDYGNDYPAGLAKSLGQVSYAQLKSGSIDFNGTQIPTVPLSSIVMAREIAGNLKDWIANGDFLLGEPQFTLPTA